MSSKAPKDSADAPPRERDKEALEGSAGRHDRGGLQGDLADSSGVQRQRAEQGQTDEEVEDKLMRAASIGGTARPPRDAR